MTFKERRSRKGSWTVRVKREVVVEIYCENCTAKEARENPHEFAVDEKKKMTLREDIEDVYQSD